MTALPGIRAHIEMDDDFEPGPRTAAAITELAAALQAEHGDDEDVVGFMEPGQMRSLTFGLPAQPTGDFASTASGSPNVLMDPDSPTGRFQSSAGGSPNV